MDLVYSFGAWTTLFWITVGIVACLLLCIVTCRHGKRRAADACALLDDMTVPVLPPPPHLELPRRADPLEAIEGIGPEIAELLRAKGIHTFDDLARFGTAKLRELVDGLGARRTGPADAASWSFQASLLARGQFEAFADLVKRLEGGRVPLESVCEPPGAWHPGREGESSLMRAVRAAGVHSTEVLAHWHDTEALARAAKVPVSRVHAWIAQADLFEQGDSESYLGLVEPTIVARTKAVEVPYPLTSDYQALLDEKIAATTLVISEFGVALARWRESIRRALRRDAKRGCLPCWWISGLAALAVASLFLLWLADKRPLWCRCALAALPSAPQAEHREARTITVILPRVLFPFALSTLKPAGEYRVNEIIETLKARAEADHGTLVQLVVAGHADISGQYGVPDPFKGNKALAAKRADVVAVMLGDRLKGILASKAITRDDTLAFVVDPSSLHCRLNKGRATTTRMQECLAQDRNAVVTATFELPPAPTLPAPAPPPHCGVVLCEHPASDYWK